MVSTLKIISRYKHQIYTVDPSFFLFPLANDDLAFIFNDFNENLRITQNSGKCGHLFTLECKPTQILTVALWALLISFFVSHYLNNT